MPNLAYQPGQLLRCVGPWFHARPPEEGHTLYEPITVQNAGVGGQIKSVVASKTIPQGAPLIYLGVWVSEKYYLVMSSNGVYAITCYSVTDDESFWKLVSKGDIDPAKCTIAI